MAKKGIDYSKIYVADDPITIEVNGVEFKLKELSSGEYYDILESCSRGSDFDRKKYSHKLVQAAVIEPDINAAKLKPGVLAVLVNEVENSLGLSEEALRHIKKK
jgi:hypothetical protein